MARLWRYLFNLSNLFVIFLISLTGINTYLSTNIKNDINKEAVTILRIEEITKDYFNNFRIILSDHQGYWLINNYKGVNLSLGSEIVASVTYSEFNQTDKYTSYYLSKGFKGNLNINTLYSFKKCDLHCKYINLISNTKSLITNLFISSACNSERWITKFFAPNINCLDIANLSKGLLVGDVSFSLEAKEIFRKTGINHLVAVSGFQVVLISSFLEWLLIRGGFSRRLRIIFISISVIFFLTLVGPEPPILRSIISIIISFGVLLMGRRAPQNKILIYSGLILLWYNPFLIFSISFQLSYLATFGLINSFSVPIINKNKSDENSGEIKSILINEERLLHWSRSISGYIIANISIFLYTLPIIISLNGYVSIWSILINIVLIPIIPIISLLNIFALVPVLGSYINIFPLTFESILIQFLGSQFLQSEPLRLSPFTNLELIVYYIILVISNVLIKYYLEYKEYQRAKKNLE